MFFPRFSDYFNPFSNLNQLPQQKLVYPNYCNTIYCNMGNTNYCERVTIIRFCGPGQTYAAIKLRSALNLLIGRHGAIQTPNNRVGVGGA